jgi:hypothetical protein
MPSGPAFGETTRFLFSLHRGGNSPIALFVDQADTWRRRRLNARPCIDPYAWSQGAFDYALWFEGAPRSQARNYWSILFLLWER